MKTNLKTNTTTKTQSMMHHQSSFIINRTRVRKQTIEQLSTSLLVKYKYADTTNKNGEILWEQTEQKHVNVNKQQTTNNKQQTTNKQTHKNNEQRQQ
mmetsp:Transcript_1208/g.2758  ORF Transcript_1208/g.2758 Transcript_1208/m.2758 type:complete len:97 (-) Transcript_1208:1276-1566(-)